MSALTPQYVVDLETRIALVVQNEYARLRSAPMWWTKVAKERPSTGLRERLIWLLNTAGIQYSDKGGGFVEFDNVISDTFEFENKPATTGLKLNVDTFTDHDGGGVELAAHWAADVTSYGVYWPQKQIASAMRLGTAATSLSYDGQIFFSTAHPLNPFDTSLGVFANRFTGSASGSYPGAIKIDDSVTLDVAFQNLQKAFTYIRSIKMPNGEDPRFLRPAALILPPALSARGQQLTNAKYIAQAAATGGGAADVSAIVNNWGIGQPIEADELGAGMPSGSDTVFYIAAEQVTSNSVGALIYSNREPFRIVMNGEMTDAELSRANELQWVVRGRNTVAYGHPYLLFRCEAS